MHVLGGESPAAEGLLRELDGEVEDEISSLVLGHLLESVVQPLVMEVTPYCHNLYVCKQEKEEEIHKQEETMDLNTSHLKKEIIFFEHNFSDEVSSSDSSR